MTTQEFQLKAVWADWRQPRMPDFWRVHLVGWSFVFLISVLARTITFRDFWIGFQLTCAMEPISFLAAAGLRTIYQYKGLDIALTGRSIVWAILLSFIAATIQALITTSMTPLLGAGMPDLTPSQKFWLPELYYFFIFTSWSLAYFWIMTQLTARVQTRRAVQAEAEALRAELLQLRMQIDPHFLFNALNGIAAEIPEHPDAALAMVRELASFLRYSLDHRNFTISPLVEEIDALESYLKVQEARFGSKLQYRTLASAATLTHETPCFLLQPLVENAVKHGFRTGGTPLKITVAADAEGDVLRVTVTNSGRLPADWKTGREGGVGLDNMRRRLELHYPGRHSFAMSEHDGTVKAELALRGRPWSA